MARPQWLKMLYRLRLEFWLPLLLLGLCFWGISSIILRQRLRQSNTIAPELQVQERREIPSEQVLSIKVNIDNDQQASQVNVKTVKRVFEEQAFELSTTEPQEIEKAIAQQLNLSTEQVRSLILYKLEN